MTLDNKMNCNTHLDDIKEKSQQSINLLKLIKGNVWGTHTGTMLMFYIALVWENIYYSSIVFGVAMESGKAKLYSVQNMALRIILGTGQTTSNEAVKVATVIMPFESQKKTGH